MGLELTYETPYCIPASYNDLDMITLLAFFLWAVPSTWTLDQVNENEIFCLGVPYIQG